MTSTRPRRNPVLVAIARAVAGSVCAGFAWVFGQRLGQLVFDNSIADLPPSFRLAEVTMLMALVGLGCGLVSGAILGLLRGRQDRLAAAVVLALGFGLTGALGGGLSPTAMTTFAGVLHGETSSALAWAAAGAVGGLGCHFWLRWAAEEQPQAEPEGDPVGVQLRAMASAAFVGPSLAWRLIWRLFPIAAVSVAALVAAAATATLSLLAVGLLGLSVVVVLGGQERRLAALERRPIPRPTANRPDDWE